MTEYESKPRPVEIMRWDGTLREAGSVADWIRSKGETVALLKRGEPNKDGWKNTAYSENYLQIGKYLNASRRYGVIVYDPTRDFRTMGDGDFDCYSEDGFAAAFRERTI